MDLESDSAAKRREQFETNCERYGKELTYLNLNKVRNKADAEEISNEAIKRFLVSMESRGWPEIDNVMAYLIRIANNICVERWRRPKEESLEDYGDEQSKQIRKILDDKARQDNDPTSRYIDDIHYGKLYKSLPKTILHDLSEEEWRLLYMHHVDQMKAKEIAEALNMNVDSVRYKLNKIAARIRHRVRRLTENEEENEGETDS